MIVPSFNGSSFLKYTPLGKHGALYFEIQVTIKPKKPTGLIWYTGNAYLGDYAMLGIRDGYAVFTMDLGDGPLSIRSPMQLALKEWHTIKVLRTGKQAILRIRGQPDVEGETSGAYVEMTLTEQLYVGGLPSDLLPNAGLEEIKGYSGCIQQILELDLKVFKSTFSTAEFDVSQQY
ncbi:hypothetical protein QYM36_015752 [Artemia franciscana]|uniref:Laminin G domain-containing protein n=1 Tax=Artemia franciscana TaxID=6661 RepID=A0AA88HH09_ARTSF|nr:hypothetical protein QYM36_015752 [Artemia franciscana]